MKSNLARSAVRARWPNELNSIWLPERGSLHTVVLFTPGKCAARWICLSGLLMSGPSGPEVWRSSAGRSSAGRSAGGYDVTAGGAGQSEQPAQGVGLVGRAERPAPLQLRHQARGDPQQVVADRAGPQPEAGQAAGLPVLQQVGQLRRRPGEDGGIAGVFGVGEFVEPGLPVGRSTSVVIQENHKIAENMHRVSRAPGGLLFAADLGDDGPGVPGVARRYVSDVGRPADPPVRHALVRPRGHERRPLRRPRGDRRTLDAEIVTGEVDVVQLAAVDEPAGGDVADLGVVLPAVPQPPDDLDVVGGLVEQLADQLLDRRVSAVLDAEPRERPAAEVRGFVLARGDLDSQAGPAGADVVESRDRLRDVERLGVGDDRGRNQPAVSGQRRDPSRDEHRVQPPAHLVDWPGRPGRLAVAGGLQAQAVFDRDKVEQAALGLADQVGPVARREELARSRLRLAPRGGVPAGAVERDGEVQGGWSRHDQNSLPISPSTQRARRPPLRYQGLLRYQGFRSPSQGLMLTPRAYVNPFNAIPIGIVE